MGKFINPFTDWGFKHIFGQEITKGLLLSFLNDLVAGEFAIKDLTFKNTERLGFTKDGRGVVFDIYCTTDTGKQIIVEMQNRAQAHFIDRSLYYSARAIADQGRKGEWDYMLVPVYTVCFLNFDDSRLPQGKFRTDMILADRDNGKALSDKLRVVYLKLPLFNKDEEECANDFERWIFVLKNMSTLERMPFLAQNAVFRRLAEISDLNTLSKDELEKYGESIKMLRDTYATISYAQQEGHAEGMKEGMAKGLKEGMTKGLKEGMTKGLKEGMTKGLKEGMTKGLKEGMTKGLKEGRTLGEREALEKVAANLLRSGMTIEGVCAATGIDEGDVRRIWKAE